VTPVVAPRRGGARDRVEQEVVTMQDQEIVRRVSELVEHEHELRSQLRAGKVISEEGRARLDAVEVQLDQCWDLLRQRRARREFAEDPAEAELRDPEVVEHYQQ
jgi:hypothetical protein